MIVIQGTSLTQRRKGAETQREIAAQLTRTITTSQIIRRSMMQNYLPLIHAIIDAFLFLETSGDNEVDPDLAVRCMENMAASIRALSDDDQIKLRSHCCEIAKNAEDPAYAKFVRELPDAIGLASESEG